MSLGIDTSVSKKELTVFSPNYDTIKEDMHAFCEDTRDEGCWWVRVFWNMKRIAEGMAFCARTLKG
jgi:hypothetical protein